MLDSGQWDGLKSGWTTGLRGFWSAAKDSIRGKLLVVYSRSWSWSKDCLTFLLMIWMMGQHSQTSLIEKSSCYTRWMCCHSEGPHQIGENGLREISLSSTRGTTKSCIWEVTSDYTLEAKWQERSPSGKNQEDLKDNKLTVIPLYIVRGKK